MAAWKTFGQKRSLRLKDVNYALPYIYHVTFALNRKLDFHLNTRRVAEVIVSALLKGGRELQYEILAFCIMLDHVHVLCQPQADQISLSRFIGRVKGKASRELGLTGIGKPVWQRGFYDHILRSEENVWDVARYIADNPVRAGLVNQFEEYPYSYVKGLKNVALKGDATKTM